MSDQLMTVEELKTEYNKWEGYWEYITAKIMGDYVHPSLAPPELNNDADAAEARMQQLQDELKRRGVEYY